MLHLLSNVKTGCAFLLILIVSPCLYLLFRQLKNCDTGPFLDLHISSNTGSEYPESEKQHTITKHAYHRNSHVDHKFPLAAIDPEIEALIFNDLQKKPVHHHKNHIINSTGRDQSNGGFVERLRLRLNSSNGHAKHAPQDSADWVLLIETSEGLVQGFLKGSVRTFLGIPYVDPPIGPYRWRRAPQASHRGKRVLQATAFGPYCHQERSEQMSRIRRFLLDMPGKPSEDCLTLNIFTPTLARFHAKSEKTAKMKISTNTSSGRDGKIGLAPVIVFVHGGGFVSGSASAKVHNQTDLVENTHCVMVSVNYRLNWAGFLASEELRQEALSGNSQEVKNERNVTYHCLILFFLALF